MPNFNIEQELMEKGYFNIAGVDEVSRGSLIGPVFAAAVVLDKDLIEVFKNYVNDSKKLSDKKRREISDIIKSSSDYSISSASNIEIDELNILNATKLAMYRAVQNLPKVDCILIDGNMDFDEVFDIPYLSIIKGDNLSLSIAAASILAKTYQCDYMINLSKEYPEYGLDSNKGYGTKKHCEAIAKFGPCDLHRKTFKRVREFC